jgi:RP/EB family microtubule-associated protein
MSTPNTHIYKTSRSCRVKDHPEISQTRANTYTACFQKHGVDRRVDVEQLIKCKMQDNLEFLQWTKRYWDQYFPGGDYDAVGRRKASGGAPAAAPTTRASAGTGARRGGTTPTTSGGRAKIGGAVVGLERERDFYFSKLRDIELLVQQAVEEDPELEKQEDGLIKHIQTILYSTEDGFEIPAEAEGVDDQETF